MKTKHKKKGRLCSQESVLLATCTLIQGSCKTNPIPGSCCYYEDLKAPQPPQTGAVTGRLVLKKQHKLTLPAFAKLPAQPIPKYSAVFFRISSDSRCEHKALWIIIRINRILLLERCYVCSCFTQKSFLSREALQLSEGVVSPSSRPRCHSRAARKARHIPPPVSLCLLCRLTGGTPGMNLPQEI